MNRPDVLAFLAQHHWVASVRQLAALGVSEAALEHAKRQGVVVGIARGIVSVAGVELSWEARALAAQLAAGREAFVSGPSAGVVHGLRNMPRRRIEISIHERRRATLPPWGRLLRTSWIDEQRDVAERNDGLRVATPLRTLFGLAGQFNQYRFERAAEDVWHRKLASPADAADYLAMIRRSGRTGVRRFNLWLEHVATWERPGQSGLELDFVELISRVGLPTPQRQHPIVLANGATIHLDLAWPDAFLAIEPGHSWWHGGDRGQRADQGRQRACDEVGWRIIPYDESGIEDPVATARQILTIYRKRVAMLRPT